MHVTNIGPVHVLELSLPKKDQGREQKMEPADGKLNLAQLMRKWVICMYLLGILKSSSWDFLLHADFLLMVNICAGHADSTASWASSQAGSSRKDCPS